MQETEDPSRAGGESRAQDLLAMQARQSPDPHIRRYSLYLLGRAHDPRDREIFLSALRDADKGVRAQATVALAGLGEPVVDDIIHLLSDADWRVRYRAAEALKGMKARRSVDPLISALSDEKDHVRYMAAKALGEMGDARAAAPLATCLADENPYVRKAALLAIGQLGDRAGMDAIRRLVEREKEEMVLEAARTVLAGNLPSGR